MSFPHSSLSYVNKSVKCAKLGKDWSVITVSREAVSGSITSLTSKKLLKSWVDNENKLYSPDPLDNGGVHFAL